jgi:hypothetical protein
LFFALKKDTTTGCFLHQKKKVFKSFIEPRARKFSRIKHTRARFKKNDNNKSAEQRERESYREFRELFFSVVVSRF